MNNGGGGQADQARADEADRQKAITSGTARINGIFDGAGKGTTAANPNAIDPSATYYDQNGLVFDPSGRVARLAAGSNGGLTNAGEDNPALKTQALADAARGGQLFSDRQTTGGFNDAFYNGRRQAYLDYANPQLEKQRGDAAKQLTFSLARSGLLNSSARATQEGSLADLYGQQSKAIGQQATQQETDSRNAVEGARSDLITMLNATGDADSAANSAIARSQALSATPAYSPLGDLFSSFTNTLGTQAAQERAASMSGGFYQPAINTGLFGVNGVTKVTH